MMVAIMVVVASAAAAAAAVLFQWNCFILLLHLQLYVLNK